MAVARWLAAARSGRPLRLFGSPTRTRDVTDVRQVVEGLLRMADRGVRGPVNLGTGRAHRLADIAAAVCSAVDSQVPVQVEPASDADVPDTLADTTRCRALLGMTLRTDLRALIGRQAAYCQAPMMSPASAAATM
jgi:nucleoside-diphosphate-sugar epimerase